MEVRIAWYNLTNLLLIPQYPGQHVLPALAFPVSEESLRWLRVTVSEARHHPFGSRAARTWPEKLTS